MRPCSRYILICFKIICSRSLLEVQVRDIGLKLFTSSFGPDLCIGLTFAFFQSSGMVHVASELLNMMHRYFAIHSPYRLRNKFGMLSGPEPFFCVNLEEQMKDTLFGYQGQFQWFFVQNVDWGLTAVISCEN